MRTIGRKVIEICFSQRAPSCHLVFLWLPLITFFLVLAVKSLTLSVTFQICVLWKFTIEDTCCLNLEQL